MKNIFIRCEFRRTEARALTLRRSPGYSNAMRRIAIIGPGGAGKSTLARQIGAQLKLPVIHLDAVYWHEGWTETPKDIWAQTMLTMTRNEAWVLDGNYGGTMEVRLAAADTIIFLDLPPLLCLWRVLGRQLRYWGRTRPDMGSGCPEKLDFVFLRWIWNYRRDRRPSILEQMEKHAQGRTLVHLQSSAQVRCFLKTLPVS